MSDHEWCRDVRRDEQVRAAEDAAAVPAIQHRDLPEQVALLWASLGDIIGRVVRLEGEMDAGQDEEAAPAVCDSASPANGLRTERVTPPWQRAKWDEALAIICDGGDWGRGNNFDHGVLGALVIWADKEMDRLTAERDAARARVAELEAAAAAPPPRGWLTAEEREAIRDTAASHDGWSDDDQPLKVIDALLARSTPPRVRRPKRGYPPVPGGVVHLRDAEWIAAIRAAGGEVEE